MKKALLIMTAILCVTPAFADDDATAREKDQKFFTFGNSSTRDRNPNDCQSPKKPDFIAQLPYLERRLIQSVYLTEVANPILQTKTCTCDMLFPTYDHAIEVYKRDFIPIGLSKKLSGPAETYIRKYIETAVENYNLARNMCTEMGIY